jgi:uncharacterized HAD superfamily protein
MIIGVDLDEVLADTISEFLRFHNYKIWPITVSYYDIKDYYIHRIDDFKLSQDEAVKMFYDFFESENRNFVKPIWWAYDKISELKNKWNDLIIVTARPDSLKSYTYDWIDKYFRWFFSDIVFTNHFTKLHIEKHDVCKKLWVSMFIEDNFDYAKWIVENWIKTFLFEKPWNDHINLCYDNLIKVKWWNDVVV